MKPEHTTEDESAVAAFNDDPFEVVRCFAGVAAQRAKMRPSELRDEPDPLADWSPMVQAARRICLMRGYNDDGSERPGFMERAARRELAASGETSVIENVCDLFRSAGFEVRDPSALDPQGQFAITGSLDAAGILVDAVDQAMGALKDKLDRAERALRRSGFQDIGGEEWKPPIGPAPRFIEVQPAPQDKKQLEADAEGRVKTWMERSNKGDTIYQVMESMKKENEELRAALAAAQAKLK